MLKKIIVLLLALSLAHFNSYSQVVIEGNTHQPNWQVLCYAPIKGYYNRAVATKTLTDSTGYFKFHLDLNTEGMIILDMDGWPMDLFVEPGDTLYIENNISKSFDGLILKGRNAPVNLYYNQEFDEPRPKKYFVIEDTFEKSNADNIWENIDAAIEGSYSWVDSLLEEKQLSPGLAKLIKDDITAKLVGHAPRGYKYFPQLFASKQSFDENIYSKIDFSDLELFRTSGGVSFYAVDYTRYLAEKNPDLIDENKKAFLSDEGKGIQLANPILQPMLYFRIIVNLYEFGAKEDYCYAYYKFIELFPEEKEYIDILSSYDFCDEEAVIQDKEGIVFIDATTDSLDDFLAQELKGKRWYADIWATWCGPCISNFKKTSPSFKETLENHQTNSLYISIDDEKDDEKWKAMVYKYDLKGTHLRINSHIQKEFMEHLEMPIMMVPRYFIVSEDAEIVNKQAPSPINLQIREVLEELFGASEEN